MWNSLHRMWAPLLLREFATAYPECKPKNNQEEASSRVTVHCKYHAFLVGASVVQKSFTFLGKPCSGIVHRCLPVMLHKFKAYPGFGLYCFQEEELSSGFNAMCGSLNCKDYISLQCTAVNGAKDGMI